LLHSKLNIILVLLTIGLSAQAQIIDTTQRINTWTLKHNYTRFEKAEADTSLEDFHRTFYLADHSGDLYGSTAIICNGMQNLDYFNRPANGSFLFGRAYEPYLMTPENTIFYNTKVPFTQISYTTTISMASWKEETASALHTQNFDPFTNFGFKLNFESGTSIFINDDCHMSNFTFFGSHAKGKYSAFGTFNYNDIKQNENGGLEDAAAFISESGVDPLSYDMMLDAAYSRFKNSRLFFTHKYNLDEKVSSTDSLGNVHVSGQNISIAHQFQLENNLRMFYDEQTYSSLAPIYDTVFYMNEAVMDSVREDLLSNVFQLIWGDPYGEKMSARIYAGHELRKYSYLQPVSSTYFAYIDTLSTEPLQIDSVYRDTVTSELSKRYYNDLFLGFHLAGPTGRKWDWNLDGKYYVAGYYANDFNLDLALKRQLGENGLIGVNASYAFEKPNYYLEQYSSAFFRWDNGFSPLLSARAEGYLRYDKNGSEIRLRASQLSNLLYFDTLAVPQQAGDPVYLLAGELRENIAAGGFHSQNRLLFQLPSNQEVLPLPLLSYFTSTYWEQSLFKGALLTQVGFDLTITSKYYANAYMPATAIFYNQNETLTGAYPFLDLFLNWKMNRTRFFLSWNNVLSGIVGNNYFTTWNYPQKPRYLRFGLVWTFYN